MTATAELTTTDGESGQLSQVERKRARDAALIRAIGLDKVTEAERELALAIAKRYDLDLLLKHLVVIDGRSYVTRDGLLWVAHRSGQLDGMQLTLPPEVRDFPEVGKCWYSETTVWRKDMSHPFTLPGRYPVSGQNKKYGPEMSIKVSECMTLRRAFNVSAPIVEERWDAGDIPTTEPEAPKTLAERARAAAEAITQQAESSSGSATDSAPDDAAIEGEPRQEEAAGSEGPAADSPVVAGENDPALSAGMELLGEQKSKR